MTPREILASADATLAPIRTTGEMFRDRARRARAGGDHGLGRDFEAAALALQSAYALAQSAILAEHRTLAKARLSS